jgi:hypothetical protein
VSSAAVRVCCSLRRKSSTTQFAKGDDSVLSASRMQATAQQFAKRKLSHRGEFAIPRAALVAPITSLAGNSLAEAAVTTNRRYFVVSAVSSLIFVVQWNGPRRVLAARLEHAIGRAAPHRKKLVTARIAPRAGFAARAKRALKQTQMFRDVENLDDC